MKTEDVLRSWMCVNYSSPQLPLQLVGTGVSDQESEECWQYTSAWPQIEFCPQ